MCSHVWHVESAGPGGLAAPLLDGLSRKEEADASALGFLYPRLRADGGLPCSAEGAVPSLLSDLEEQPPVSLGAAASSHTLPMGHPSPPQAGVLLHKWAKRPHPPHVCGDDEVEQFRLSQAAVLGPERCFHGLICFLY